MFRFLEHLTSSVADDATNTTASLYMRSGPARQADFQTAEMAPIPGRRAFVSGARARFIWQDRGLHVRTGYKYAVRGKTP